MATMMTLSLNHNTLRKSLTHSFFFFLSFIILVVHNILLCNKSFIIISLIYGINLRRFSTAFLTHVSSVLITFVTLAVFLSIEGDSNDNGNANDETAKFTTGSIFAALALFNQLTVPLFIFPLTVPIIISAIVSTKRLERFLALQEVQKEFEGIRNMARVMSRSDASLDVFEIEDNESQSEILEDVTVMVDNDVPVAVGGPALPSIFVNEDSFESTSSMVRQPTFYKRPLSASVRLKKNNPISSSTKLDRNKSRQKSASKEIQIEISSDLAISVRNGVFSWQAGSLDSPLRIDSLEIPKGQKSPFS